MSPHRSRRGHQKAKAPAANKGRSKAGKGKPSRKPAIEPDRPFWSNDAAEAELRAIIGVVSPAKDPTALVRSLGSPPLGRFADNAQHYYAVVYEKAQRFAMAMATANGVLVVDGRRPLVAKLTAARPRHLRVRRTRRHRGREPGALGFADR